MTRLPSCLFAGLLALSLQGCVAAIIPLAAGAAMTTGVRDDPATPEVESTVSNPKEPSAAQDLAEEATLIAGAQPVEAIEPRTSAPASTPASDESAAFVVSEGLTSMPAPVGAAQGRDNPKFAAFADYALSIAALDPLEDRVRPSALLARPGLLTPERAPCRFTGNAVLIDLDSQELEFDPDKAVAAPSLGQALQRIRAEDVEVVWSTSLTADRAGDVRSWLKGNQLDPDGEDRLLLLRYPDDRKQTRREEASKERCLIAMLGDERSDFDELFDYLKDPKSAFALDAMLGDGWFLAPVQVPIQTNEGPSQ